jgi:hypothetical protein
VSGILCGSQNVCDSEDVVTTDPWFVDGDLIVKPRLRFVGRHVFPDGLEAKGGGGGASKGDSSPMLS